MEQYLSTFSILHSDDWLVERYVDIKMARRRQPIGTADAWIAATALAFQLELVTHNPGDFQGIPGLTIITEQP